MAIVLQFFNNILFFWRFFFGFEKEIFCDRMLIFSKYFLQNGENVAPTPKNKIAAIGIETKELAKTAKEEEGGKKKKRVAY